MSASYPVDVMTWGEINALRLEGKAREGLGPEDPYSLAPLIAKTGRSFFAWRGPAHGLFSWVCPTCGYIASGELGPEPRSGWDDPAWVNRGTLDVPTLMPSLGCPNWRRGTCTGHWWLRDGVLVPA